ncbi:MAG TPA: PA domain-containing protein [Acidobacteriota bacterium]|nr:PA domain-containing protein [Acidobacteriota bacterium]
MKNLKRLLLALLITAPFVLYSPFAFAVTITINNVDDPNEGFNDPTPAAPIGGNTGTTVGQQRLNVFTEAATIWGATLTSNVDIVVQSTFQDRGFTPCTSTGAVLGAAGTIQIFSDFPNAEWPNTWYHSGLANKLADTDLTPGPPDPGFLLPPFNDDIIAFFNEHLGEPGCLDGTTWYYGLDNNAPAGTIDLLNVLLHELGHGLGFANFITESTGSGPLSLPDIYTVFTKDNTTQKQWNQMTDRERAASTVNTNNVVWNGPTVVEDAPFLLQFPNNLIISDPAPIAGEVEMGPASFGPPATPANFSGEVVLADDGTAPNPNDGCEAITTDLTGVIGLVDRGNCDFVVKAANAQAAGATGLIIANTLGRGAFTPGGTDPSITIPVIGISEEDGQKIKDNLPGVEVFLQTDFAHRAGADEDNNVLLYAPNPVEPGSSISHWDVSALPNLIMEPFINSDLEGATDLDLTPSQLTDIGWDAGPHCPVTSDQSSTVVINGCDSGVANDFGPFTVFPKPRKGPNRGNVAGGCTVADVLNACITPASGNFNSCITRVTKALARAGIITNEERKDIKQCANQ